LPETDAALAPELSSTQSGASYRGSVARVGIQVAEALAHAHGQRILHRDIKPSNLLLDAKGTVWVTDFGLAKADGDNGLTRTGDIVGTLRYMAPERFDGWSDARSDVYALGATLYELLTLHPPFGESDRLKLIDLVLHEEPTPPRKIDRCIPRDLETIVLKALAKEPGQRYTTAEQMAEDLRRFVIGDPIHARPTPACERAWKWGKRRPAVVALLGVSTLAVLSMVLFVVWHNVSLRGKLDVAIAKERRARQGELDALQKNRLALVQQEGQKLFDSARLAVAASDWPNARLDLEKALTTIGSDAHFETLREPALALLKQVEHELHVEADRRASGARFQSFVKLRDEAQFLGTLYTGMDLAANLRAARTAVREALAVYDVLAGEKGRPRFDADVSDAQQAEISADCSGLLLLLAETEAQSISGQKPLDKEQYLRKALGYLEAARRLGAPRRAFHLRRARYLSLLGDNEEADRAEKAAQAAALDDVLDHFLMADELYRREQFDAAIREFEQVLERKPGHFLAQYLNALCLLRQQRPAEARALLTACLAQRSDFVWPYLLRGFAQQELQAYSAAEADFRKAEQMHLQDDTRYVISVSRGVLHIKTDRIDDAIADLKTAIRLKPGAYQAFVNLAQAYRQQGRLDPALEQLQRAVELEPGLAHLYRLRARLHLERNELDLALSNFERAIERENANSPYQVDDHIERGRLLLHGGRHAEALASFDAALALRTDHSLGHRLRIDVLLEMRRYDDVIRSCDALMAGGKASAKLAELRGLARAALKDIAGAMEDTTLALALSSQKAILLARRGWLHLLTDAPRLALRDFDEAIHRDGFSADAYTGRGYARMRVGELQKGLADAEKALGMGDASARLYYNAARIYVEAATVAASEASQRGQRADVVKVKYQDRAVLLLREAFKRTPVGERPLLWRDSIQIKIHVKLANEIEVEERPLLWRDSIRADPALRDFRQRIAFLELAGTVK
jgi:tetratricopeptide (TPR) repeat protein